MVNRGYTKGQSIIEYILMLACLTLVGIWILDAFTGSPMGKGGAIHDLTNPQDNNSAVSKIAADER